MKTLNQKLSTLFLVALFSFTSSPNFAFVDFSYGGMGLDIIQGKTQTQYLVMGDSCGESQIFVYDSSGKQVLESPLFTSTNFTWKLLAKGLVAGTYSVIAQSERCALQEFIVIE